LHYRFTPVVLIDHISSELATKASFVQRGIGTLPMSRNVQCSPPNIVLGIDNITTITLTMHLDFFRIAVTTSLVKAFGGTQDNRQVSQGYY
jgi:hypothetical protein